MVRKAKKKLITTLDGRDRVNGHYIFQKLEREARRKRKSKTGKKSKDKV